MVTNTELTIDQITQEALIVLKNKMAFGNRCLRQFDASYGRSGAKIGDNLRIRVPVRYQTTTGPAASAQNFTETYRDVAAQTQRNVILNFSTKDLSLAIDDFSDRVITPALRQMASDIDTDGTLAATVGYTVTNTGYVTANYAGTYAGFEWLATPGALVNGTTPATFTGNTVGQTNLGLAGAPAQANAAAPFFGAQAILTNAGAPYEERYCVISPAVAAQLSGSLYTLFNPQREVSDMFQKGIIGTFAGAEFYESPSVQTSTNGNWANTLGAATNVSVTVVNGASSIALGNVGVSAVINSGDQFVVANVYSVNPLTRISTGQLQIFTAVGPATANALGNVTVNVFPTINATGQYQTVTAVPASTNTVTFMGGNTVSTQANFMYNKNAIAMVVAPLDEELDGASVSRIDDDNLSLRFVKQYQASTDLKVYRLDILYTWATVRPELGCLIKG
jgi:hypothetical protein